MSTAAPLAAGLPATVAAEESQNPFLPAFYDIFWSAVVIAVLAFFFYRYLMPKMTQILDERTAKIEGGLELAAKTQAEAEQAKSERDAELVQARHDAAKAREAAQVEGADIIAEARAKAQAEAARISEVALRQIESERQSAVTALRADVGGLATELASRIVGESLADDARQSRIIDRFLDDFEAQIDAQASESGAKSVEEV